MATVFVCTDANWRIGAGHLLRCLVLARTLVRRGCTVEFICKDTAQPFLDRLAAEDFKVEQLPENCSRKAELQRINERLAAVSESVVVLDSYAINAEYEEGLSAAGKVVSFDDIAERSIGANVIINQNYGAESYEYDCPAGSTVLAGARYALIRDEMKPFRRPGPVAARGTRIVAIFGGSDTSGQTAHFATLFCGERFTDVTATLVMGPASGGREEAEQVISGTERVELTVAPVNMAERAATADLAVITPSVTALEMAYLGIPAAVLVTADNQLPGAERMSADGLVLNLGRPGELTDAEIAERLARLLGDAAARQAMADRGQQAVDGRGAERIADIVLGQKGGR